MEGATNNNSGASVTKITEPHQKSAVLIENVARLLFSSDYYRKVDRTTDIAGRLPNAIYTLPPRLVQAIVGRAELSAATRVALVAECKKFFLASREYEKSKEVFVDRHPVRTTITLDCGRLYSEGDNIHGQCGIGSVKKNDVAGPRLIRLPPVLDVWHDEGRWFANTTRGLYAWGWNYLGKLGVGGDEDVWQPRRVLIDSDVLDVSLIPYVSFFRTVSGWFGCGSNRFGELGLGRTNMVTTPARIPGSEGVTWWGGGSGTTFGFSHDGLLVCGENNEARCGIESTDYKITTLTPVVLPDDVKGRVDRVVCNHWSSFFIADRRCFACGFCRSGQLGLGSDERAIPTPAELPVPVDDIVTNSFVTIIRSGDTLLACGDNEFRQISTDNRRKLTTPTPLDPPGPVMKVVVEQYNVFIQLTDGAWVGSGLYRSCFIPVSRLTSSTSVSPGGPRSRTSMLGS